MAWPPRPRWRDVRACVADALVLKLIELALKAPTGSNAQNRETSRAAL